MDGLALDLEPAPRNQVAVRGNFTGYSAPQGIFNDNIATYNVGAIAAVYALFGNGCAGSAGVPTNTAVAPPRIGQTMVANVGNLPPPAVLLFMVGLSRTTCLNLLYLSDTYVSLDRVEDARKTLESILALEPLPDLVP